MIRREVPLAAAAVVLFAVMAWAGLTPVTATILAAATGGALWLLLRWAKQGRNEELASEVTHYTHGEVSQPALEPMAVMPAKASRLPAWFEPVRALLGLGCVLAGAQLLVANASTIAADLGVSQIIIGFTVVAVGTSLPELITTIQAMRHKETDLVVGNLFGSNLFNSLAG